MPNNSKPIAFMNGLCYTKPVVALEIATHETGIWRFTQEARDDIFASCHATTR
ncbi:MAG: hypothetical protein ACXW1W_20710 [Methylococcaceae bacterium]